MAGPLQGLKILDFTTLLPGPYATMMLADLGAEVLRIVSGSRPDLAAFMPPFLPGTNLSAAMACLGRGKRCITLNLKDPRAVAIVRRLVAEYDIVIEQFRPGVMARFGLDYETLKTANPGLIYCSLTGYPDNGPWRRKAGHDLNFLAVSGFLGLEADPHVPPTQIADMAGSLSAVAGILAVVIERATTGRGRRVSVSMAETAHSLLPVPLGEALAEGTDPQGPRWWNGAHPFYRLYETADGRRLAVAALEKPFALSLLDALGLESLRELADDPLAHAAKLESEIARVLRGASAAEWEERLKDKDVCVTTVLTLGEARAFMDRLREPGGELKGRRKA